MVLLGLSLLLTACGNTESNIHEAGSAGERATPSNSPPTLAEAVALCGVDSIQSELRGETENDLHIKYNGYLARVGHKYQSRSTMPVHIVLLGEEGARLYAEGEILDAAAHMFAAVECAPSDR